MRGLYCAAFVGITAVFFLGISGCMSGCTPKGTTKTDTTKIDTKIADGTNPGATGANGAKLKKEIVGTWTKDKIKQTFKEDGTYEFVDGDLKINGNWKAVSDSKVDVTFKLAEADAKTLKSTSWEAMKKSYEKDAAAAKAAGGKEWPAFPIPEPKTGDNTWQYEASVPSIELTLAHDKLKKS
jgi:hypothetical protein